MKKIVIFTIATALFAACGTPATEVEVVNEKCDTIKCVDTCKAVEAASVVATPTVAAPASTVK